MRHWVHGTQRTPHWVHPTHPMPHWGASPARKPAADAPNRRDTQPHPQPVHPTSEAPSPSPAPRYEASLRSGGACQGIFPALTSTPRPSAQSSFGVPHARTGQCRRQATRPEPRQNQLKNRLNTSATPRISPTRTHSCCVCANVGSPGPKFTAGIPNAANRATSVHPNLAAADPPAAATSSAAAGADNPGNAPGDISTNVTSNPSKTPRTCASTSSAPRSGANR